MYKIIKEDDHFAIYNVEGNCETEVKLTGNSKAELVGKMRLIALDLGIVDDVYNEAIKDIINKIKKQ